METNHLILISFIASTLIDACIAVGIFVLFCKLIRTKTITTENNREIYEHDNILADLQEQVEEISHKDIKH